jgi:hypothetical protein
MAGIAGEPSSPGEEALLGDKGGLLVLVLVLVLESPPRPGVLGVGETIESMVIW